jgi:hypothetical protein
MATWYTLNYSINSLAKKVIRIFLFVGFAYEDYKQQKVQ